MQAPTGLFVLAYLLMFLGIIGAILPLLPGPIVIWLGVFLWAWANGFRAIGWPTLLVLGILTVLAWSSDLLMTTVASRRAGAGWKAVAGAIAGGILGGLLLGGLLPVVGTVIATILGGVVGILAVEYLDKGDWRQAFRAGRGYVCGFLIASLVELLLSLLMIAIFSWQAFF